LPKTELWKGLRSIGMVEREYLQNDKLVIEQRYFIVTTHPLPNIIHQPKPSELQ
jgi:hypothetical protein